MSSLIKTKLICANVNTCLKCADYSKKYKCLIYGSSNLIHIHDPEKCKTYLTLNAHTDRVNSLKWINNNNNGNDLIEFISVGSDGKILHWINGNKENNVFDYKSWKLSKEYKSSDSNKSISINCIETLFISRIEKYFAIFTSNGILDLFYFDVDLNEFKMFYSLDYSKKLQDTLCLTVINKSHLLLLTGGYDRVINIHSIMRIKKLNLELQKKNLEKEDYSKIKPVEYLVSLTGHENDIRDINCVCPETHNSKSIFFCSSSQDNYIRIWNITKLEENSLNSIADKININKTNSIYDEYKSKTSYVIKVEKDENNTNLIEYDYYNITLESILQGHEDSVSSIQWEKVDEENYYILSSSFDYTVSIWVFDKKHNMWNKEYTLGEMIGNKHQFFYATFLDSYKNILAYSYNGAFYNWKMNNENQYESNLIIHGHFNSVNDIKWDPSKNILFSCSKDETTRAFIYWKKNDTWHEVNRPQIHGYIINTLMCQNIINENNPNEKLLCKIITGADEKLLRIFTPPFNLIKFLKELSEIDLKFKKDNTNEFYELKYSKVEGMKQALTLMNRQVILDDEDNNENDYSKFDPDAILTNKTEQFYISKYNYSIPPNEDFLCNNTLWPEEKKIYGHGNEIFSSDISHNGKYFVSGEKSQREKNSKLHFWNIEDGKLIKKLDGHNLTIAQIEFSPNDNFILSCSRDRSWCLYKKISNNENYDYELFQSEKNAHDRIIWSCSWGFNEKIFCTGSRDKIISIWEEDNLKFKKVSFIEMKDSVTSVDLIKFDFGKVFIIISGLEDGSLNLLLYNSERKDIKIIYDWHIYLQHGKSVKRIRSFITDDNKVIRVGSCSDDFTVRIFDIDINELINFISDK